MPLLVLTLVLDRTSLLLLVLVLTLVLLVTLVVLDVTDVELALT